MRQDAAADGDDGSSGDGREHGVRERAPVRPGSVGTVGSGAAGLVAIRGRSFEAPFAGFGGRPLLVHGTHRSRGTDGDVPERTLDFPIVSHPSLGRPPLDLTAGSPEAADGSAMPCRRWRRGPWRPRSTAIRRSEIGTTRSGCGSACGTPSSSRTASRCRSPRAIRRPAREYADWTSPVYRRKGVPLDDLINLCEGLRAALPAVISPEESVESDRAIDEAIAQYRWHRRLAGDARKRNAFLQFIYKGG